MPFTRAFTLSYPGKLTTVDDDCYLSGGHIPDSFSMEVADQRGHTYMSAIASRQTICHAIFSGTGEQYAARVAAQIAAEELKEEVPRMQSLPLSSIDALIQRVAHRAHEKLMQAAQIDPLLAEAGIDMTMIFIRNNQAAVYSIGECETYCLRSGDIQRMTGNETNSYSLPIHFGEANTECRVTPAFSLRDQDRFVLLSPGLVESLTEKDLQTSLEIEDIQQAARNMTSLANSRGCKLSLTAMVIAWAEAEPEREVTTSVFDFDAIAPAREKVEYEKKDLNRDLKMPKEKKIFKNDYWEHFPVWAGYLGLALGAGVIALLIYFIFFK